ncbi:hypothetical protein [Natrinema sp. SYSU A 869]|uniref:hypothetical protein n=1 Tax=Natrinema sp. SYSU A 869 TaxID=2871694 RepID=UPI00210339BD|nr:hypothetical protein [Natrinema sp. SYSU A 869]
MKRLADRVEVFAEDQGSDDPHVVVTNYFGEEEARKRRREFMGKQLAAAFEEDFEPANDFEQVHADG